jgi:CheY-like chemotaxis protein
MTLFVMNVLVIDDDAAVLRVVARYLRQRHDPTTAISAAEAFTLIETCRFDVILCDLHMPGMTGAEFVARLPPSDVARVVFMTGDYQAEGLDSHIMLRKPFTAAEMFTAIDRVYAMIAA